MYFITDWLAASLHFPSGHCTQFSPYSIMKENSGFQNLNESRMNSRLNLILEIFDSYLSSGRFFEGKFCRYLVICCFTWKLLYSFFSFVQCSGTKHKFTHLWTKMFWNKSWNMQHLHFMAFQFQIFSILFYKWSHYNARLERIRM